MSIIRFIRNWTLPIAMLTGIIGYFVYVNIHALDGTHTAVAHAIEIIQPTLIFLMLFVSFCKISPRQLRPHKWHLKLLAVQVVSFSAIGLFLALTPEFKWKILAESAMICLICPTATAAAVVTGKLGGNANSVVSYTCLINLAAAVVIPAIVPMMHESADPNLDFGKSFTLIIGKVFPILILPLFSAWVFRYLLPKLHKKIVSCSGLAFYLWAVALTLAIAVTMKAMMHHTESVADIIGIGIISLICCVGQFALGRYFGRHNNEMISSAQGLGQKNTVFAIWMGYTFLNPLTAMAGGFYSVWHNVINSYQLYEARKRNEVKKQ